MSSARGSVEASLATLFGLFSAAMLSCGRHPGEGRGAPAEAKSESVSTVVQLAARRERSLSSKPIGVASLDVDGDGTDEVLATLLDPGGVVALTHSIYREGTRTIARSTPYPLRLELVPRPDGEPILALAERSGARLSIFSQERFDAPIVQRKLPAAPRALDAEVIGGRWCVAVACDGGKLELEREGAPSSAIQLAGSLPRAVRVLASGPAVAVAFQDSRTLAVCTLEGGEEILTSPLPGLPRSIAESDLDRDGDMELVVAGGEDSLWVYGFEWPGGAKEWIEAGEAPLQWTVGDVPVDVEAVDLDRDGKDELIVICAASLTAETLGDFTRAGPTYRNSIYAGQTPLDCCAGYFNGDEEIDLAIANRDSLAVSFLLGKGGRSFHSAARSSAGSFPNRVTSGNLLGDPHPELATLNAKDGSVAILEPLRSGSHVIDLPEGSLPIAAVAADFWSQGENPSAREELAVFVEGNGSSRCELYRSSPWELAATFALPLGCTDALALEVEGDGQPDLLVADAQSDRLWLFLNRMTRGEGDAPPFEAGQEIALASGPCALELFELDPKKTPGVAVALGGPGPRMGFACLALNQSEAGAWLVEQEFYGVEGIPIDLAAEDFNGDGREDIAVIASPTHESPRGFVHVFLRQKHGFQALDPFLCGLKPRHVAAGDLDFDGRAEIAVAAQNSHVVNLLRQGPSGQLERLDDVGAGIGCLDLAMVDVDLDGALDLLVANAFSNDVSVVLNQARR